MKNEQTETSHALRKGKSLGSTVNSEMSTNKIVDFALKIKHSIAKFLATRYYAFRVSRISLLLIPCILTLITAAANIAVVIIAGNMSLPNIMFYNLIVVLIFITASLFVFTVLWAYRELFRFKEGWSLINTHTTLHQLQSAIAGKYGSTSNLILILTTAFIILNISVALGSTWTLTPSLLGTYPCTAAKYDITGLGIFTITPDMLTGALSIADISMLGLTMQDGILTGMAPVAILVPIISFTTIGNGPCIAYKVICDEVPIESDLTLNATGSYSEIINFYVSIRTFYFYINMHFPSAGYMNSSISTPWQKQQCYVEGQLGKNINRTIE